MPWKSRTCDDANLLLIGLFRAEPAKVVEALPKRLDMRWRGDDFKPIQAEVSPTAKAACDYADCPEVKPHEPSRSNGTSSLCRLTSDR